MLVFLIKLMERFLLIFSRATSSRCSAVKSPSSRLSEPIVKRLVIFVKANFGVGAKNSGSSASPSSNTTLLANSRDNIFCFAVSKVRKSFDCVVTSKSWKTLALLVKISILVVEPYWGVCKKLKNIANTIAAIKKATSNSR